MKRLKHEKLKTPAMTRERGLSIEAQEPCNAPSSNTVVWLHLFHTTTRPYKARDQHKHLTRTLQHSLTRERCAGDGTDRVTATFKALRNICIKLWTPQPHSLQSYTAAKHAPRRYRRLTFPQTTETDTRTSNMATTPKRPAGRLTAARTPSET